MANQRQKPAEQLQGRGSRYKGTSSITLLPLNAEREIPPCPRGLSESAKTWWSWYWSDPVSQVVSKAAWRKVQRLVTLYTKLEVVEKKIWAEPLIKGSMEQDVMNPLLALQKELTREIEKIESGLGLLPNDQMRLVIAVGQAKEATVRGLQAELDAATATEQPRRRIYGAKEA
jgi:P27 family predicted phage terminase small subunit